MTRNGLKNTLQILIFLIFNSFLAQEIKTNLGSNKTKDTIDVPKEQLEDILHSKAQNIRNDIPKKMTFLNKSASISYQDLKIEADYICINWETGDIFARGKQDDKGHFISPATSTQAGKKYEYNEVKFNYKTKQAIAYNARTEEQNGVIVAQKTKKINDSVFYMRNGIYTTDEFFLKKKDSVADYHLSTSDIKLVRGKKNAKVITGPVQMYIEQVPTPLLLPFAIFPFSEKRSSGLLMPSFGERQDVGFYLSNLGYYQPIGEHFDLKIMADLYTKWSWSLRPELNYKKNYKYSGNFQGEIGTTITGIKGLSNYSKSRTYRIVWNHYQDPKANPYWNFSASVNIVSNQFYNNTINNSYIFNQNTLNSQQTSSISLTKRFLDLPITITGNASYYQNFTTKDTEIRLPQLNVAINQFYLFKPKNGIRSGLLENINFNTSLSFINDLNIRPNDNISDAFKNNFRTGLKIPLTLSTNTSIFKFFTFSLGANFDNVLTNKTIRKEFDATTNQVVNHNHKSISGYSTFSTSASLQTILYGQVNFKKTSKIQAIRHMVTPSIGFSYTPDFGEEKWGYYKTYLDANNNQNIYSIFEGGVFGEPYRGLSESINFNIGNNIEMKVRSDKDSSGVKKIKIFESLNISGSYNFAAKNFKWSPFYISTQNSFFNHKVLVNTSLSIDPYQVIFTNGNDMGTRVEKFGLNLQNFSIQLSVPLNNSLFESDKNKNKKSPYKKRGSIMQEPYLFDDDNYAHFSQPWSLNVSSSYSYSRFQNRFGNKVASLGLDGNIKLTPYWTISGSAHYDIITKKIAYTRLGFSRDQRSFTINFNWVPLGQYKVYDFFIGIKANILSDALKYETRNFSNQSDF